MHTRRFDLLVWVLCCLLAAVTLLIYVGASAAGGHGELIMPLDDVYIHFQYARQIAAGQPYIYNPGGMATSGATSFLYPYVLAGGYLLGFRDLTLGLWAMGVGALALLGSMWTIYLLLRDFPAPRGLALLTVAVFGFTGSIAWHFMSGMETGLVVLFLLLTLYMFIHHKYMGFVISAMLLALIRPEGSVLAVLAVGLWGVRHVVPTPKSVQTKFALHKWRRDFKKIVDSIITQRFFWLGIPVLACAVQPLVNLALTGSAQASGSAAKSILNTIPHDWGVIISRVLNNFIRMWGELFTGYSPREGWYVFPLVFVLAVVGLIGLLGKRDGRFTALLVIGWLLALTGAVSTLDTAFWHFKRYQVPALSLFVLLAGWGAAWLWSGFAVHPQGQRVLRAIIVGGGVFSVVFGLIIGGQFVRYFHTNVGYVYAQPYQMALWLRANTPEGAVVAVHDVGMMRYIGGRTTLDIVGLTTPGAAEYWRNGPGSVAEFLISQQPDYIASYGEGHGYGLGMLAQTSLYANELARFEVELDDRVNVALAANVQGIYAPEWVYLATVKDQSVLGYDNLQRYFRGFQLVDHIDVADLSSEIEHNYVFEPSRVHTGFPTEVHEFDIAHTDIEGTCLYCFLIDGGRFLSGSEQFVLQHIVPAQDIQFVTRLVSSATGEIDIFVGSTYIGTRIVVAKPGELQELHTIIPREFVTEKAVVRIVPHLQNNVYSPYAHSIYQGLREDEPQPSTILAVYQAGAMQLADVQFVVEVTPNPMGSHIWFQLIWYTDGSAEGDYRQFVHLYGDINQPPIAQWDGYPGNGTLPPGNWLPGVLTDRVLLSVSGVASGTYRLAIGFYNPYTQERLMPTSDVYEVSPDGRLWLGEVEIP